MIDKFRENLVKGLILLEKVVITMMVLLLIFAIIDAVFIPLPWFH